MRESSADADLLWRLRARRLARIVHEAVAALDDRARRAVCVSAVV
jgi:hypothetical protein